MNSRNIFLVIAGGGLAALLAFAVRHQVKAAEANAALPQKQQVNTPKAHKRVAKAVAGTLKEHQGEDSPVVQAFQEALQADKG